MASKYLLESSSIYLEDAHVPYNKLGLINIEEWHELERELLEEAD